MPEALYRLVRSQMFSNSRRRYTRRTAESSAEAGSPAITSPSAVKPITVIRCPEVPYPAPVSSVLRKDWDVMAGMPAATRVSRSASEASLVTTPCRPWKVAA